MLVIEEKIQHCKICQCKSRHERNTHKSSGFMVIVHVILTLMTYGVYLIPFLICKLIDALRQEDWQCKECSANGKGE